MRKPLWTGAIEKFAEQVRELWGIIQPAVLLATANVTAGRQQAIECDPAAGGAGFNVTLPLAASAPGKVYIIWKTEASAFAVFIVASGSDLLQDGSSQVTNFSLSTRGAGRIIMSNGRTLWKVIATM